MIFKLARCRFTINPLSNAASGLSPNTRESARHSQNTSWPKAVYGGERYDCQLLPKSRMTTNDCGHLVHGLAAEHSSPITAMPLISIIMPGHARLLIVISELAGYLPLGKNCLRMFTNGVPLLTSVI